MRCCICGCEFNGYGNNPDPLCASDDNEARCCDDCNSFVTSARMIQLKQIEINLNASDEELTEFLEDKYIVIFYSHTSTAPTECIVNNGKFLTGEKIEGGQVVNKKVMGSWGHFLLDLEKDNYVVIDKF